MKRIFILIALLLIISWGCKPRECPECVKEPECVKSESNTPPLGLPYVYWNFGSNSIYNLEHKVSLLNDPGTTVGLYFQMYQGVINGNGFYYGFQTNVCTSEIGCTGKGVIFSRWGTADLSNVRTAPNGWSTGGTSEGATVSVRLSYDFKEGDYAFKLSRAEADGAADWYDLYITDSSGAEQYVGGLRFQRSNPSTPAIIDDGGITWMELYYFTDANSSIPLWYLKVSPTANDGQLKPVSATSAYGAGSPVSDVYSDTAKNIYMIIGGSTPRCHPAGELF